MTELPDNILHLPQYQVLGCKSTDDEMHFQVDVPDPIACEECGVQGECHCRMNTPQIGRLKFPQFEG